MIVATIARDTADSPNMQANDAAILEQIAVELRATDAETIATEDTVQLRDVDIICHMSRNKKTLEFLQEAEREGTTVINSPGAVQNCSRSRFMHILEKAAIPQPPFKQITKEDEFEELPYPAWIKHSEGWSRHKDDVCFANTPQDAVKAFRAMQERGIGGCIHCGHVTGDIIKFYGVGRRYFHYSYPDPEKSKFGLEKINGAPHRYPFSLDEMKRTVFSAAESIGLEIYGGDCIVCEDGAIYIIDMNDFPSFSAIRDEAAGEIAEYIINRITEER
jgi:glutathione synthase/RimK-type ligase-like ATP-grasp enzyme